MPSQKSQKWTTIGFNITQIRQKCLIRDLRAQKLSFDNVLLKIKKIENLNKIYFTNIVD